MNRWWVFFVVCLALVGAQLAPAGAPDGSEPPAPSPAASRQIVIPDTTLTEQQMVLHLLNRLGYGPRPGDVERVREIGLAAYIEQQLHPQQVPDVEVERRLHSFETLRMTPTELIVRYPPPPLLRGIERQLTTRVGMSEEEVSEIFPELERFRERTAAREDHPERPGKRAAKTGAEKKGEAEKDGAAPPGDPIARELERMERMSRQQRMREALQSFRRVGIELSQAKLIRAVYSERQLQEVMTDFWFNHFNVFIGKGADRYLVTSYEHDAIRPHVLGKFRDLAGATARHPAMLFYLDNWMSSDPDADVDPRELRMRYARTLLEQGLPAGGLPMMILQERGVDTRPYEEQIRRRSARMLRQGFDQRSMRGRRGGEGSGRPRRPNPDQLPPELRRRGLNENYARELLELHTLGVDGGYSQQDIVEVARCFTGWTLTPIWAGQQFIYLDEFHDKGKKVVLDHEIEAGGMAEGEAVLDLLARHSSTARFISTKLARRFVSDDPPESLIEEMAVTFLETDGEIREVLRAMFSSKEFWSADVLGAKIKTPLEFVASAARATDAEVAPLPDEEGGAPPGLVLALRELGQPAYQAQPPTGYKDTADAWVSTGGLLNRLKVAMGLATNRMPGLRVSLSEWRGSAQLSHKDGPEMLERLGLQVFGRAPREETLASIEQQLAQAEDRLAQVGLPAAIARTHEGQTRLALGWMLASAEFQRR